MKGFNMSIVTIRFLYDRYFNAKHVIREVLGTEKYIKKDIDYVHSLMSGYKITKKNMNKYIFIHNELKSYLLYLKNRIAFIKECGAIKLAPLQLIEKESAFNPIIIKGKPYCNAHIEYYRDWSGLKEKYSLVLSGADNYYTIRKDFKTIDKANQIYYMIQHLSKNKKINTQDLVRSKNFELSIFN